jgi:xanthine dehydrogenase accessory factor
VQRDLLAHLLAAKAAKRPVALVTRLADGAQLVVDGDTEHGTLKLGKTRRAEVARQLAANRSGRLADSELFVQVHNPPLRLIIIGAVHITQVLAPMATLAGYDVTVIDPRRAWATDARFPGILLLRDWPDEVLNLLDLDRRSAVVALTHDPKLDDPALSEALQSEAFYIAALGSPRTHGKRLKRLGDAGFDAATLARIHGPAGLDIGARSPAEIAISVLAEMTAALHDAPRLIKAPCEAEATE